jgi:hypothetical protein
MEHQDRLKSVADDELLAGLSRIVHRRNQITAEFRAYLAELDRRQLFLDLGYPSLFEYCVSALGLCESTAGRHIAAARVCRNHAQALAMVARGELHASALSLMKKHITAENAAELFESCTRKSARQVEELLAARLPKPDVADLIRRLPTPNIESSALPPTLDAMTASTVPMSEGRKNEVLAAAAATASDLPEARRPEPLSADRYGVHFTADGEFCQLLERVRGLAGHRLPSGDLLTLLKRGLEAYEHELEKERFAVGRKPKSSRGAEKQQFGSALPSVAAAPASVAPDPELAPLSSRPLDVPSAKRTRRRPAAVAREVFLRDGKQCSYVSADGRRRPSRRCLELDHVRPWAMGGSDEPCNLRVRCRAHNQRYARQCFGELHVRCVRLRRLQNARVRPSAET